MALATEIERRPSHTRVALATEIENPIPQEAGLPAGMSPCLERMSLMVYPGLVSRRANPFLCPFVVIPEGNLRLTWPGRGFLSRRVNPPGLRGGFSHRDRNPIPPGSGFTRRDVALPGAHELDGLSRLSISAVKPVPLPFCCHSRRESASCPARLRSISVAKATGRARPRLSISAGKPARAEGWL